MDSELQDFIDSSFLFQDVFNDAHQGVIVFDTNLRYAYWNDFIAGLTGFIFDDVKHKKAVNLFPFLQDNGLIEGMQNVIKFGLKHKLEFKITVNNKTSWVLNHAYPIKNNQGKIIGGFSIVTEITKQKKQEEKLRISEERFMLAVKGSRDGLWDWDLMSNKVFFSETWKNQLGYSGNEVKGNLEAWSSLLHPDDKDRVLNVLNEYFEKKLEIYDNEFRMLHKDGSYRWIRARGAAVRDENGIPVRMAGSHTDITESKHKEALIESNNQLLTKLTSEVPGLIYQYQYFPDGRCCFPYANQQIVEIYEVTPEEVKNDASIVMSRIHKEDSDKIADSIEKSANELSIWEEKFRVVLPKKGLRWIHGRSRPEKLNDGSVLWNGYLRDITEQYQAEIKLKESQERWQFALEGSGDGVWDWNLITDELYYSPQLKSIFGYNDNEFENKYEEWYSRVHKEDVDQATKDLNDHIEGKTDIYINEHRIKCKDGSYKWMYDRGKITSFDKNGKPTRFIGTMTDITERREMEQNLRLLNDDKNQFISILGHDLKGPLGASLGILERLAKKIKKADSKTIEKEINLILKSNQQTYALLEDILNWSRINSNQAAFNPTKINTISILEEKLSAYTLLAENKNITLQLCKKIDDVDFCADDNMIRTVFRNLIGNALKYTNEGGLIKLGAKKEDDSIVFFVEDNGIGMSKELMDKLFTSEKLISIPGTSNEKGTGLGLLLAKGIIEKHEGEIWVESELGKGSTFKFKLPFGDC